jgi:cyclophilin family peptidyl-prolyl cis-trans isomerase
MSLIGKLAVAGLLGSLLLAQAPPAPAGGAARDPGLYATFQTSMGNIVVKLFENESPITVKNFVDLQLGRKAWLDPKTAGGGNVGFTIKDEFHPSLKFDQPGLLAMANAGPGTGASQFFITQVPTPHLNGAHTIFGKVVEGMDVVNAIAKVPTREEKPVKPVVIKTITFERVGDPPANDVLKPATPKKAAPAKKKKK